MLTPNLSEELFPMTLSITRNKTIHQIIKAVLVAAFWLLLWYIAAKAIGKELLLPSPLTVLKRLSELILTGVFWESTISSLFRIFAGIMIASAAGAATALLTSRIQAIHDLLYPIIAVIRSTPIASFVILALLWIGKDSLSVFISALIVFPVIWGNVGEGVKNINADLTEVAKIYRFPFSKRLNKLYIPSLMPYFISGFRTSIGLAWKAGIAAEVLANPEISIGRQLYESKLYLETTDLFAWTVVVVLLSLVLDIVLMSALKKLGRAYNV